MADDTLTAPARTDNPKPMLRPADPRFSCGPVKKYPGWSWEALADAPLSRTHRSFRGCRCWCYR